MEKITANSALKTEALAIHAALLKLAEARKRNESLAGKREKSSAWPELTYECEVHSDNKVVMESLMA